jgi:hypothetical protein
MAFLGSTLNSSTVFFDNRKPPPPWAGSDSGLEARFPLPIPVRGCVHCYGRPRAITGSADHCFCGPRLFQSKDLLPTTQESVPGRCEKIALSC